MLKVSEDKVFKAQRNSITKMKKKLNYHEGLYKLTKHSKKKAKHLANMKFMRECILDAYVEYGWH